MSEKHYQSVIKTISTVDWKKVQVEAKKGLDEVNRLIEKKVREMDDLFTASGYVFTDSADEVRRLKDVEELNRLENSADSLVKINNGIVELMLGLGICADNDLTPDNEV